MPINNPYLPADQQDIDNIREIEPSVVLGRPRFLKLSRKFKGIKRNVKSRAKLKENID